MRADRPSSTATLIAAATVFLARGAATAGLVPPGAEAICARCLAEASPRIAALIGLVSRRGLRWTARLAERATIPGLPEHFLRRKRWIERAVRAALEAGLDEVAVVAAGFDTLAARLAPQLPRVRFVEIDHPATQRCKRAALGAPPANLRFDAADLAREPLAGVGPRSIVVVEGLLMYLDAAQVAALFGRLAALQAPGARVAFSVMEPAPDGRLAFHNATWLVKVLLARWHEPFRSVLGRGDAAAFLARHGYRLLETAESGAPARGELLLLAEREAT